MNIILWIIFGAIVGWITSIVISEDSRRTALSSMMVGVCGGLLGGFFMQQLAGGIEGVNLYSLIMAVGGSLLIVVFFIALTHVRSNGSH